MTRFPLFFPEKRPFFLDGADIFAFGAGIGGDTLIPFFSRRIGLVEGQQVPILAGIKTTGRVGQTNFGGLVVRTREQLGLAPPATMAVVRVKQNVFGESRAGFIATAGDPLGRPGSWELGGDFTYQTSHLHGDKNFSAGIWALATGRDDLAATARTVFGLGRLPERLLGLFPDLQAYGDGLIRRSASYPVRDQHSTVGCAYRRVPRTASSARCSTSSTRF